MICFGIANSSPERVLDLLVERGLVSSPSKVAIVSAGSTIKPDLPPKRSVMFILSIADLFHNLSVLNSPTYEGVRVFLFASPLRLKELEGCIALDMKEDVSNRDITFKLAPTPNFSLVRSTKISDAPVKRLRTQYLTVLVDNVKRGSLMTPLMTFIYTLPRATQQTPAKEAAAQYLCGTLNEKSLVDRLSGLLSAKNLQKLLDILESDVALKYKQAFRALRTREIGSLKSACTKYDVTDYEMKYLMSVVETAKAHRGLRNKSLNTIQRRGLTPKTARTKAKVSQPGAKTSNSQTARKKV